jgi:hypothetical protein
MDELIAHVGVCLDRRLKINEHMGDVWTCAIGDAIGNVNPLEFLKEIIHLGDTKTLGFLLLNSNRQGQSDLFVRMLDGRNPERMTIHDHLQMSEMDPTENCDFYALYYDVIKYECWRRGMKVYEYEHPWPSKEPSHEEVSR